MYEFNFILSGEQILEFLSQMHEIGSWIIDDKGVAKVSLELKDRKLEFNIVPFLDEKLNINLRGWGFAKETETIDLLANTFNLKINLRKMPPSIEEIALKIKELAKRGIKSREMLIKTLGDELSIDIKTISRAISMIKDMAKRRIVRPAIKEASQILKKLNA
ncbi:MAG: hypothetical protein ACP6IQ_09045 [Candidatus Njordarchaeia archaeon]